jgi:hypothetical protein
MRISLFGGLTLQQWVVILPRVQVFSQLYVGLFFSDKSNELLNGLNDVKALVVCFTFFCYVIFTYCCHFQITLKFTLTIKDLVGFLCLFCHAF